MRKTNVPRSTWVLYLSGPITGCSFAGSTRWTQYVEKHIASHVEVVAPLRGQKVELGREKSIKPYYATVMSNPRAITEQNLNDVRRCHAMLVNLLGAKRVSIGTAAEIGMAIALGKPIILIIEKTGNLHDHPVVLGAAGWRVESVDEGIHVAEVILGTGV